MKKISTFSVIGLGKLGASMAAAMASRGFHVIGVDVDPRVVERLNEGRAPVKETNLQQMIASNRERLRATTHFQEALLNSEISFVVVPTPTDVRGAFSLRHATEAFSKIGRALKKKDDYHLVVLTSTVLPGSTRYALLPALEHESEKICGPDFGICYSPAFIALGSVIRDFLNPDFTLIGEFDGKSGSLLEGMYTQIMCNSPPCKRMSIENAELTKIALNTFVTTKITYANMLAQLCEKIPGGDVDVVTNAIGADSRVGRKFLTGAAGYGGPCFPRDNVALSFIAKELGAGADIAEATHGFNRLMVKRIVEQWESVIRNGRTVAILGLAYKPSSHVVEESQGLFLARKLAEAGARVVAYDPLAGDSARAELSGKVIILDSMDSCLRQAQLVFVTTPDPEFMAITPGHFSKGHVTVVDFWRILDKKLSGHTHIRYIPIGRSIDDVKNSRRLAEIWKHDLLPQKPPKAGS